MKALRRAAALFLAAMLALAAGGCWDYKETEDLLFVMGVSFDRTESGRLHGVIEISTVKGMSQAISPEYIEVDGDTFHDVIFNADKIAEKPLNWSHIQVIIVSQDVARNDMDDLLDMCVRMPMIRDTLVMLVSKEATAHEIIEAKNPAEDLNSFDIVGSLKAERQLEKAPYIMLYEFADAVADEGQSAVLPAVGLAETSQGKVVEVSGEAVFRGAWLQGFLNEIDTRSYLLVDFKKDLFNLPLTADPGGKFTSAGIGLYLKKVDIVPEFSGGRAKMEIYIRGEISISEISGASTDPDKLKTVTDAILASTSAEIENSVTAMIRHTQQMGGCDILGVCDRMRRADPKTYKQIGGHWRDYYSGMDVRVVAGLILRDTGVAVQPLTKGR